MSSGGRRLEPDRKHRRVQGGEGRLEADSLVGQCDHAVLGSACQEEGWVDVVPLAHGHRVAEASAQSGEAEGDGSEAVADPEDHGQGLAWGGMHVRWQVGVRTLLPSVQEGAYLDVRWLVAEAREDQEGEGDREDLVEGDKEAVVVVCKVQEEADGRGVQEGGAVRGVRGLVEVLGPWGPESL